MGAASNTLRSRKRYSLTQRFIKKLEEDKGKHLSSKIDTSIVSMEINNRWKHYLRCQLSFLDLEEFPWVDIIQNWLEGEHILEMASYFQNEMIFADFFLKDQKKTEDYSTKNTGVIGGSKRARKSGKDKKMVYNYWKQFNALEEIGEQKGRIKNMFFSTAAFDDGNSESKTPLHLPRRKLSSMALSERDDFERIYGNKTVGGKGDFVFKKSVGRKRKISNDNLDKRLTLNKIRENNTVLKNVNEQNATVDGLSEDEQSVFKRITQMLEKHLTANEN